MRGEEYRTYIPDFRPRYSQPYSINVPEDLNFHNSAAEEHAIMKGHAEAKHEAKRKFRERKRQAEEGW